MQLNIHIDPKSIFCHVGVFLLGLKSVSWSSGCAERILYESLPLCYNPTGIFSSEEASGVDLLHRCSGYTPVEVEEADLSAVDGEFFTALPRQAGD